MSVWLTLITYNSYTINTQYSTKILTNTFYILDKYISCHPTGACHVARQCPPDWFGVEGDLFVQGTVAGCLNQSVARNWIRQRETRRTVGNARYLGKPSRKKSAVFLNIVQKAFDPPLSFEHHVVNFFLGFREALCKKSFGILASYWTPPKIK